MTKRMIRGPVVGSRISATQHPTYEPGRNMLVCPMPLETLASDPDGRHGCGWKSTRVGEMESHIIGNHTLTEEQAREWLSAQGFNEWKKRQ